MLDAAGSAFAEHGFHGASMDAIAHASGISKPMLYNYFGSKDGLYAAYVRRSGRALIDAMREAARFADPPDQLRAGIHAFFTYVEEHRAGWSVLHREVTNHGGAVAAEVADLRARIATAMTRTFIAQAAGSHEDPTAHEAAAHAFVGAGESLATWWLTHPTQSKAQLVDVLLRVSAAAR